MRPTIASFPLLALLASPVLGQWNPTAGQWGKEQTSDLRVMTFNVLDTLCSTNTKNSATNNWAALARLVAALQPDVLILQECGDNSGNGSGTTVDTVAQLTTTIGLWLRGGTDTFRGNVAVTSYVQAYAPGYDLPYVFVSTVTDNFNRNVILSRYPFADLNGDGRIDIGFAAAVGATLVRIHATTAVQSGLAPRFATDHIFAPIRLEPYLAATAERHPDCAARLHALIAQTQRVDEDGERQPESDRRHSNPAEARHIQTQ